MKHISKILSSLLILALLAIPASAGVQNRDAQLIINGNFENGTTGWLGINVTLSTSDGLQDGENSLRTTTTSAFGYARINPVTRLTAGETYRVTGLVKCDGTATPRVSFLDTNSQSVWEGQTIAGLQTFDSVVTLSEDSFLRLGLIGGTNRICDWDNISITPYYGTIQNREVNILKNGSFENGEGELIGFSTTETIIDIPPDQGSTKALRVECTGASCNYRDGILSEIGEYMASGCVRTNNAPGEVCVVHGTSNTVIFCTTSSEFVCFSERFTTTEPNALFRLRPPATVGHSADFTMLSVVPYLGTVQNREVNILKSGSFENGADEFTAYNATQTIIDIPPDQGSTKALRVECTGTLCNSRDRLVPENAVDTRYRFKGCLRAGIEGQNVAVLQANTVIFETTSSEFVCFDTVAVVPAGESSFLRLRPPQVTDAYGDFTMLSLSQAY